MITTWDLTVPVVEVVESGVVVVCVVAVVLVVESGVVVVVVKVVPLHMEGTYC